MAIPKRKPAPKRNRCACCNHPQVADLDRAILMGTPVKRLEEKFQVTAESINGHKNAHIKSALPDVKLTAKNVKLDTPQDIIDAYKLNYAENVALGEAARKNGDVQLQYKCLVNTGSILDRFAKSYNLFSDQAIVNIDNSQKKIENIVNNMTDDELRAYIARKDKGLVGLMKETGEIIPALEAEVIELEAEIITAKPVEAEAEVELDVTETEQPVQPEPKPAKEQSYGDSPEWEEVSDD